MIEWVIVELPVSRLHLDYVELDFEWVTKLVDNNAPATWKPISVIQKSKCSYVVKDGNHRAAAAKRLGLKKVQCELLAIQEQAAS